MGCDRDDLPVRDYVQCELGGYAEGVCAGDTAAEDEGERVEFGSERTLCKH